MGHQPQYAKDLDLRRGPAEEALHWKLNDMFPDAVRFALYAIRYTLYAIRCALYAVCYTLISPAHLLEPHCGFFRFR